MFISNFKRFITASWSYCYKLKSLILLIYAINVIGITMGYFYSDLTNSFTWAFGEMYREKISEYGSGTSEVLNIFLNNIHISLLMMMIGLMIQRWVTWFFTFLKSFQLGMLMRFFASDWIEQQIPFTKVLTGGLLPHGVLELLAFSIMIALTIHINKTASLGPFWKWPYLDWIFSGFWNNTDFKEIFFPLIGSIGLVVIPLFLVSAFIEVNITPIILQTIIK